MTAPAPLASSVALAHHAFVASYMDATAQVALRMWDAIDPDDIVDSWARQLPELTAVVSGAQLGVARAADEYVAEALDVQGLDPGSDYAVNPEAFMGASDGGPLMSLLTNPVVATLLTIQDLHDVSRALRIGRSNLDMLVRTQVADAARGAEQVSITSHPSAQGYIRQTDGNPCARCLVLAGSYWQWNQGFRRHPRCGCIHVPAGSRAATRVLDARQVYDRMSRAERLRAGFTVADMRALEEGADIIQIVNARHRPGALYTAGGRRLTREGTTRRGLFGGYEITEDGRLRARSREEFAARRQGERYRRVKRERLTTDEIYRQAGDDREAAIRLLRQHGYIFRRYRVHAATPSGGVAPAAAPVPVRRILQRAETVEDVSRVLAEEYRRITGRSVIVDLRGSVETAREHAEGVLRVVERNPQIDIVSVRTGPTINDRVYAEMDRRNIIFNEYWSAPENRQAYLGSLAADTKSGWLVRGSESPIAVAAHEAGHVLDPGNLAREIDRLLDDAARRMGVTRDQVVPLGVSRYAERSREELVGEAVADVAMNGARASDLSRDIVRLVESGGRGAPAAVVDLSRQSVTRLRATVQSYGITVPPELDKAGLVRLAENLQSGMPPQQARAIAVQAVLDEKKVVADALVRAHELLGKEASDRALRWLANSIRRGGVGVNPNAPEFQKLLRKMKPLLDALDAADEVAARAAISTVARSMKLRQIGGEAGEVRAFARGEMAWIGQQRGEMVYVIRPGYAVQYDGELRVLMRAEVMPATPEQAAAARATPAKTTKKATKRAAPAQRVATGDRALEAAPIDLDRLPADMPEADALLAYRSQGFRQVNDYLARRGVFANDPVLLSIYREQTEEWIRAVDAAMARSRLTADVEVWRGLQVAEDILGPRDKWPTSLVGRRWTDPAFVSTSAERDLAAGFAASGVMLRIRAPQGTPAIRMGDRGEAELLLNRGLTFRVTGDRLEDGIRVLDVEVVPATPAKKTAPRKVAAPKAPPAPEKMTAPALRRELSERGVDLDVVGVPKDVLAEQVARIRAGAPAAEVRETLRGQIVERQRAAAEVLIEALSGGSPFRVRAARDAVTGWPMEAQVRSVVTAMRAERGVQRAVATAERRLGLIRLTDVEPGQRLVRPGYAVEVGGERVVLVRPEVEAVRGRDIGRPSRDVPSLQEIMNSAPSPEAISQARRRMTAAEWDEWRRATTKALREGVEGTYAGLHVEVDDATAMSPGRTEFGNLVRGRLEIAGRIVDAKGSEVGRFERYIEVRGGGELVAVHRLLDLNRRVQGSGFAEEFNANLIEWYRRSGVTRIHLHADIDVGGYAWAAKGFDFRDERAASAFAEWAAEKVNRALRQIERGGPPPRGLTEGQLRELAEYVRDMAAGRRPASAPEIARFGRREGQGGKRAIWPGKWLMLGSDWQGVLHL